VENHAGVTLLAADRRRIEGARRRWTRGEADTKSAVRAAYARSATIRELAAAAGVSRMTVQRWVREPE
jgi:DNA-binding MurR/RpiR family transcriptional regulator